MSVTLNADKKEIYIEDLGVTFRTMMAVAARGYKESQVRRWHVVYKGARIGLVQVKTEQKRVTLTQSNLKGSRNARLANRTEESVGGKATIAQAPQRANLALVAGSPPSFCKNTVSGAQGTPTDGAVQSD